MSSASPLLELPREPRDVVWRRVDSGMVIHLGTALQDCSEEKKKMVGSACRVSNGPEEGRGGSYRGCSCETYHFMDFIAGKRRALYAGASDGVSTVVRDPRLIALFLYCFLLSSYCLFPIAFFFERKRWIALAHTYAPGSPKRSTSFTAITNSTSAKKTCSSFSLICSSPNACTPSHLRFSWTLRDPPSALPVCLMGTRHPEKHQKRNLKSNDYRNRWFAIWANQARMEGLQVLVVEVGVDKVRAAGWTTGELGLVGAVRRPERLELVLSEGFVVERMVERVGGRVGGRNCRVVSRTQYLT